MSVFSRTRIKGVDCTLHLVLFRHHSESILRLVDHNPRQTYQAGVLGTNHYPYAEGLSNFGLNNTT